MSQPSAWIGLLTLTVLEIVLGVDNIVFISILAGQLPVETRDRARRLGLIVALVSRMLLLVSINWVKHLTTTVFVLPFIHAEADVKEISWKDVILIAGGLFLIYKSVREIHDKLGGEASLDRQPAAPSLVSVLAQIFFLDVIFSLDTVVTAVGMSDHLPVMILAIIVAVGFMLFYSGHIARFIDDNPTIKMLALMFLVLIGANLIGEGCGQHIEKGYTYFAMAFAVIVEVLNLKSRRKPVA